MRQSGVSTSTEAVDSARSDHPCTGQRSSRAHVRLRLRQPPARRPAALARGGQPNDRAVGRPLRRAHPRPAAGARRACPRCANAPGATRSADHGGGRHDQLLAQAWSRRAPARLLRRARRWASIRTRRRAQPGGAALAGADQRHHADPRHVPAARRPAHAGPGRCRSVAGPCLLAGAMRKVSRMANLGVRALQYGEPAGEARLRARWRPAGHGVAAGAGRSSPRWRTHALDIVSPHPARPANRCWSTSRAGRSSTRGWRRWACACCRCRARPRAGSGGDAAPRRGAAGRAAAPVRHRLGAAQPTGASLSLVSAGCCAWPEAHDFAIVGDDTYAPSRRPPATRLAALDGLQRTVTSRASPRSSRRAGASAVIAAPAVESTA